MVFTNFEKSSFKEVSVKKNASTILKKTRELVWLGQSRQFFLQKQSMIYGKLSLNLIDD